MTWTWKNWSQAGIDEIPERQGVYAIVRHNARYNTTTYLYVGRTQTRNLRERVQEHYDGDSHKANCIKLGTPTHVGYEIIATLDRRKEREKELIERYNPICND